MYKNINKYNLFAIIVLLIVFIEFMLLPLLFPLSSDDLVVIGWGTTGHFIKWNSRLGETIATKILQHLPYIVSYILMGVSYISLMLLGFYMAMGRMVNLRNIKEVLSLTIMIYLMAFYYHYSMVLFVIAWFSNYTISLIFLIIFSLPIYEFINKGTISIKRIKLWYFLTLCTAWSHEIIALLSFIMYFYVICYAYFIKRRSLPKWFYGLIFPWILGVYLVSIGGLNRIKASHDALASNNILGFLKEQNILDALKGAFIGYPQNTYIITVLIAIVVSFVINKLMKGGKFVLFSKLGLFLLEFIMLLSFSLSNYIFLHSTNKIAFGATNYLLFFTFVMCVRLFASLKLDGKLMNIFGTLAIIFVILLPISPLYTAYYMKEQRSAINADVDRQVSLGIKDIIVFQEYEPKNLIRELGVFKQVSFKGMEGITLVNGVARYGVVNNWSNDVFVDYYNYYHAPNRYSYKHNPILKSIKQDASLENPILNPDGTRKK